MKKTCRIADLRYKEVINVMTGARLGFACDVEIDMEGGRLSAVVIPGALRFFGLLGREDDIVVPWESIERIGDDIILVRHEVQRVQRRERRPGLHS